MNRKKWSSHEISIPILALKLVEEVGEVAKEICYAETHEKVELHPNIIEELKQVEFLARTLRLRVS